MSLVFSLFSRKPQATQRNNSNNEPDPPAQLRTPSPSVDSTAIGKPNLNQLSPSHAHGPPPTPSPPPGSEPVRTRTELHTLIMSIPPQTLHTYTLDHLPNQPEETLAQLAIFFRTLVPPPRLHCVRCHKHFFDVENNERSCLVPHDDDSAEVERVSKAKTGSGTGAGYETLWGCCGKTVEGDGDMGPPDGWCYEGKHTVRFF